MPEHAHPALHDAAAEAVARFHPDVVAAVASLVAAEPVVVIGMGWNPHVKRARKALDQAGVAHAYHEIGNYSGQWRERLAVKMWSRWPTFPQVFVRGKLLGGANETQAAIASGQLQELLAE